MSWSHISAVSLNQFSDMTFGEFKKTYLWSEPQVKMSTRLFVWIFVRDAGPISFFFFFPRAELLCDQRKLQEQQQTSTRFCWLEEEGKLRDGRKKSGGDY